MALNNTPFLGKYKLRLNYTGLRSLAKELGLETIDDLGSFFTSGKVTEDAMAKTILQGMKTYIPEITIDDLKKEGGFFDQFMDIEENNGFGGLMDVAVRSLIDSGVLSRAGAPRQADDMGEASLKQ